MTIREAILSDAPDLAKVKISTWNSTYKGMISDEFLASLDYSNELKKWITKLSGNSDLKENIFVCTCEKSEIVGFVLCSTIQDDPEYDGEIIAMYVLNKYQHLGCGKLLFDTAVARLHQLGVKSLIIWTLKQNSNACDFYRAMGGLSVREKEHKFGDNICILVAFGWNIT